MMTSRARVINSLCFFFLCVFFVVGFFRPDYYHTPMLLTLAVKENHSLVIKDFCTLGTSGLPFECRRIFGYRFSLPDRKHVCIHRLPVVVSKKVTALLITEQTLTG